MAGEALQDSSRLGIPQPGGVVVAGGEQAAAVGGEGDGLDLLKYSRLLVEVPEFVAGGDQAAGFAVEVQELFA